jgi:HipA-like protein
MRSVLGDALKGMFSKRREPKVAQFRLMYAPAGGPHVTVGYLTLEEDGRWAFAYDSAYRQQSDLRPIEGFDDLDRVYRSTALFPFFAMRIPDPQRADVRKRLRDIEHPDATDLLRAFGRRSAASPAFELVEA